MIDNIILVFSLIDELEDHENQMRLSIQVENIYEQFIATGIRKDEELALLVFIIECHIGMKKLGEDYSELIR